jgi:predicted MPP superfamily phosphohydrolase
VWKYIIPPVIIAAAFAAFYNGIIIRHYIINTKKFSNGQSIRAVLISDLHNHIYGNNQEKLISKITKQKPDVILLAGDIADDAVPIEGTKLLLSGIKDIAPVFYVSGNHEYWSGDIESIKKTIRSFGAAVLEDEYKEIAINNISIIIAGVDDPEWVRYETKDNQKSMHKNFTELQDKTQYKILVAHRPELIETYKKYSFDLVVSGHAHGGQVRIPFVLNGLYSPNQGWFPKYAGGEYHHGDLTHIVSRGVSFNPRLPRVFNPPEIVVIDIVN